MGGTGCWLGACVFGGGDTAEAFVLGWAAVVVVSAAEGAEAAAADGAAEISAALTVAAVDGGDGGV